MQVSVISFGAAPLGGVYESTTEEQCIKAVHEAFELGKAAVASFTFEDLPHSAAGFHNPLVVRTVH